MTSTDPTDHRARHALRSAATARLTVAVAVTTALSLGAAGIGATGAPRAVTPELPSWQDGQVRLLVSSDAPAELSGQLGPEVLVEVLDEQWAAVRGPTDLTQRIADTPGVREVSVDPPMHAFAADPLEPAQHHLHDADVPEADVDAHQTPPGTSGAGVVVAVIDSGIDTAHVDLQGAIWTNPREVPGNGLDDDGNGHVDDVHGWDFAQDDPTVDDGQLTHGTHVATTIAARRNGAGVVGVAPGATILPVKVLHDGPFPTSRLIGAIDYAVDAGADIINLSVGTAPGTAPIPALDQALSRAHAAGVLVVAAAGNDGVDLAVAPVQPGSSSAPGLVTVAALAAAGGHAGFSNHGDPVEVHAPGERVLAGVGGDRWFPLSGTSMASPIAAGVAALVVEAAGVTPLQARAHLVSGAVVDPALHGRSPGSGRASIAAALRHAGVEPGPDVPPVGSDTPPVPDLPAPGGGLPTPSDDPAPAVPASTLHGAGDLRAGQPASMTLRLTQPGKLFLVVRRGNALAVLDQGWTLDGRPGTPGTPAHGTVELRASLPGGLVAVALEHEQGWRLFPVAVALAPPAGPGPDADPPAVAAGVSPSSGPAVGGTLVTIASPHPDTVQLRIGGLTVPAYRTGAEVRAFTRNHAPGTVDVVELDDGARVLAVHRDAFTFVPGGPSATPPETPTGRSLAPDHPLVRAGLSPWLRHRCEATCTGVAVG